MNIYEILPTYMKYFRFGFICIFKKYNLIYNIFQEFMKIVLIMCNIFWNLDNKFSDVSQNFMGNVIHI